MSKKCNCNSGGNSCCKNHANSDLNSCAPGSVSGKDNKPNKKSATNNQW